MILTVPKNLAAVEIWLLNLPMSRPHKAAHGSEETRSLVVISARSAEEVMGWGESPALSEPSYTAEYTSEVFRVLDDVIVPQLQTAVAAFPQMRVFEPQVVGHQMALCGLGAALLDLELKTANRGLVQRLENRFGPIAETVATTAVVSTLGVSDALLSEFDAYLDSSVALV